MGNSKSQEELPEEISHNKKVNYHRKRLQLSVEHVVRLWKIFSRNESDGILPIRYFYELLNEDKSIAIDEMLKFIGITTLSGLNFGQFVDVLCIFCLFEVNDMLR